MARIRTIKPEFWTSEQIVACSANARLLFIGLWNFCDDGGRMPYSVKNIKMRIFPGDDISSESIRGMIAELSSSDLGMPLVIIYEIEGKQYLQVTGWDKHQRIQRPSYQFPDRSGVIPPSVGFHNPRPFHERSTPEGNGRESKGKERKGGSLTRTTHAREGPPLNVNDDWPGDYREQFAAAYPHKVGMAGALAELDDARIRLAGKVAWRVVMEAVATYAATKPPDRQWANPKTWITEERWNDRPAPASHAAGNGRVRASNADIAAELAREAEERERGAGDAGRQAERIGGAEAGGDHAQAS